MGILPDGTPYEILAPEGFEIGAADGISAVPVWVDGGRAGEAVGVTRFSYIESLPPNTATDRTTIDTTMGDRLIVPSGSWAMVISLNDYSVRRQADLEMIDAREQDGLIVIDLPAGLQWAEPSELPVEMAVHYREISVVRGCNAGGSCSPDGQIMVQPVEANADVSDVRVRIIDEPDSG